MNEFGEGAGCLLLLVCLAGVGGLINHMVGEIGLIGILTGRSMMGIYSLVAVTVLFVRVLATQSEEPS